MANSFKSALVPASAITSTSTKTTVYTAGSGLQSATLIGLSIANVVGGTTTTNVDVYITRASVDHALIKGAPVPPGGTLVVIGGDQKVVMQPNDILKVLPSVGSSIDVIASYLEIS